MPWKELTPMSQKIEFVHFAIADGSNIAQLCRRFGISRKTGYKWINRFKTNGYPGLADRSRKPKSSPAATADAMQKAILQVRSQHRAWGGRKIRRYLQNRGWQNVPAASTITAILKRTGKIDASESLKRMAWQRFQARAPNALWQMDFKGHFAAHHGRCHPLTVLDDHSRFSLGLEACDNEKTLTVKQRLSIIFKRYGLPQKMLMDNGSPWGSDRQHVFTPLTAWLIRQGIGVIHTRPYHPQTLGKDERFHRTFKAEVGQYCIGLSLQQCQTRFDTWRDVYNFQRPHQALDMQVPAARYRPSHRRYSSTLLPIAYGPDDQVRKVQVDGKLSYQGNEYFVSKAFRGERVAIRCTPNKGLYDVYFCNQKVAEINVKEQPT